MAPAKLLGILLLFFIFLKSGHCGKKKGKTIKIHVPYYVKHIHHYKKIYVPKVQVIKHEHHHKKEHDHHHHHHGHDHGHYHSYDKAGHGYPDESSNYDAYYDDIDNRNFGGGGRYGKGRRGKYGVYRASGSEQYQGWRDVDGTEYRGDDSIEDEEDYSDLTGPGDLLPGPGPTPYRPRIKSPNLIVPVYRKKLRGRGRYNRRSDNFPDSKEHNETVSHEESEEPEEEEEESEEEEAVATTIKPTPVDPEKSLLTKITPPPPVSSR